MRCASYRANSHSGQKVKQEIAKLASQIDQYQLSVANALWGERTYPFKKTYIDTINKHYETGGVFPVGADQCAGTAGEVVRIDTAAPSYPLTVW